MDRAWEAERATETAGGPSVLDELMRAQLDLPDLADRLDASERRFGTEALMEVVRHGPALEALYADALDRRELEERLDVSKATSHRLTRWLCEQGMARKADGRFELTPYGHAVVEELLKFERNVDASRRLTPLLECICPDHQEFDIEPFADATVTVATPADPYRPVDRFVSLARESTTFRGFNTTHMVPLALSEFYLHAFEGETEIIYLPAVLERLEESYPDRVSDARASGHLRFRSRARLPYGLVLLDDRVGVGGYDEETGAMRVFVDTGATIARQWAERVWEIYRADSEPLDPA